MKPSLIRRAALNAFILWPLGVGSALAGVTWQSVGDGGLAGVMGLAWPLSGVGVVGLWVYYCDRSGLSSRLHDALGLTRNLHGLLRSYAAGIEAHSEGVRQGSDANVARPE